MTGPSLVRARCDADTVAHDARGRFAVSAFDCLGRRTSEVKARDAHGLPTETWRYLNASGTGHVTERVFRTPRGVGFLSRSDGGAHAETRRAKGGHAQCPDGTALHEHLKAGGGAESVTCMDRLARTIRTATLGFGGEWVHADAEFDALGRVRRASEPHYKGQARCAAGTDAAAGQSRCWTETTYDILGRVTRTVHPDGSASQAAYSGLATVRTNALGQTRTETRNALGETVSVRDHHGGAVEFDYDAQGNRTRALRRKPASDASAAPASVATAMSYNLAGHMTGMADPDRGTTAYRRNALGELRCAQAASGRFTVTAYDGLGRMASRKDYRAHPGAGCDDLAAARADFLEADAAWTHDGPNGLGLPHVAADSKTGYRRTVSHDALGRPSGAVAVPGTGAEAHHERTTYDAHGRVFQVFDASRTGPDFTRNGVRHVYDAAGHLTKLQDAVGTTDASGAFTPRTVYREVTAMDARGNATAERLGNGVARTSRFDGRTGRVLAVRAGHAAAGDRQDLAYAWDALGNLTERRRTRSGATLTEEFCHDGLNRLTRSRATTDAAQRTAGLCASRPAELPNARLTAYDGYGNIRSRTGAGAYAYDAARPHAVASVTPDGGAATAHAYDADGSNTSSGDGRAIAYTAFGKPATIAKGSRSTAFAYGPDRSRFRRVDQATVGEGGSAAVETTTTLYLGSVERITRPDGTVQVRRRIGGVAIETGSSKDGGCAPGGTATLYVLRDHLGSVDVLLDGSGKVVQDMAFGPWGQRRTPGAGNELTEAERGAFDNCRTTRAFTGHEAVDGLGAIHMNGRIYDPAIGRFLQADPFVQFPADMQSWNRYSYVLNNPLAFTDPSGHFLKGLLRPLAAVAISVWMPGAGFWTGTSLFAANGIGAVAASGFVAGAVSTGTLKGAALSAFSAAAFFGVGEAFDGAAFQGRFGAEAGKDALRSGLTSAGLALKSAAHGAAGGVMAVLQGGRFGHGFLSGAAVQAAAGHVGGLKHGAQRVAASAALGGTLSAATGGKFANGAATGAFSRAFNEEVHRGRDAPMVLSAEGEALLRSAEGLRLMPYDDQTGEVIDSWVSGATIGYGRLISKKEWDQYKDGITKAQAVKMFRDDLTSAVANVNKVLSVAVSQHQFDAAVMLSYNIGPGAFADSSAARLINNPGAVTAYPSLEAAWKAFNRSQGSVNAGLINRRNAEWRVYSEGIYQPW